MVSRNLNEYLQIDLLSLHAITSIKTQGRFGKGQGQEFTEAYVVEYWRSSFGNKWKRWKNIQGKEVRVMVMCRKKVSTYLVEGHKITSFSSTASSFILRINSRFIDNVLLLDVVVL